MKPTLARVFLAEDNAVQALSYAIKAARALGQTSRAERYEAALVALKLGRKEGDL